ncbi:MAG: hypothetical protein BACD_03546 [Bacteroides rodentium]
MDIHNYGRHIYLSPYKRITKKRGNDFVLLSGFS